MTDQIIHFISRAFMPETKWDLVVTGVVFVLAATGVFLKLKIVGTEWAKVWRLALKFAGFSVVYFILLAYVVPRFQRFGDDEVGILIPRFTGHALSENLGGQNLNEAVCLQLRSLLPEFEGKMNLPGVSRVVAVRSVSWMVDTPEDAAAMRRKYRAGAILWGKVTRLGNTAKLIGGFDSEPLPAILHLPGLKDVGNVFEMSTGPEFTIRLNDSSYNLPSIGRSIINDFLPVLAARVYEKNPQLAADLVNVMPNVDPGYVNTEISGFLLYLAAMAFEQLKQSNNALKYFGLSYSYLKRSAPRLSRASKHFKVAYKDLASVIDDSMSSAGILLYDSTAFKRAPCDTCNIDVTVGRFMTVAKMKEGLLLLRKGEKDKAVECFNTALSVADSALLPIMVADFQRLGFVVDSALISK